MPGLTSIDVAAFVWFFICVFGYAWATHHGRLAHGGLILAINRQRAEWMENMAQRDNRMVDIQVLGTLSRGNAFFASTAVIVTGALAAVFTSVEELQALTAKFPFLRQTTVFMWQVKVIFLIGIFVFAFFKFAWAFRLSNYTAIMIGATPIYTEDNAKQCLEHAARAATLAGLVGQHANSGMRAYYFGLAGLGWFIHPVVFMLAVLWVVVVLYRREYRSRALRSIATGSGGTEV